MQGWISLHRSIKEHWIFSDDKKFKWWVTILLSVNHTDTKTLIKGTLIECNRGQSIRALQSWADQWNVTKKTVSSFFKLLEKDEMIKIENLKITTRITVCNYGSYQGEVNGEETQSKRKVNGEETQSKRNLRTNNNENNDNNDNNDNKLSYSEIKKNRELHRKKINDEIWNSHEWINSIAAKRNITYEQMRFKINQFGVDCKERNIFKESVDDFKNHFLNWYKYNNKFEDEEDDIYTHAQKQLKELNQRK